MDYTKLGMDLTWILYPRKNSKIITKNIIKSWIENFFNFDPQTWEMETTARRIIAWSSNFDLTLENSEKTL